MSTDKERRHKEIVREYYRIKNEADYEAADAIISDDFAATFYLANGEEREFDKQFLIDTWSDGKGAFPDMHYDVDWIMAEDDRAVAHVNYTGTHEGELYSIEPTGNTIDVEQHLSFRFEDEQIVEMHSTYNALNGWWRELGVMPPVSFTEGASARLR